MFSFVYSWSHVPTSSGSSKRNLHSRRR